MKHKAGTFIQKQSYIDWYTARIEKPSWHALILGDVQNMKLFFNHQGIINCYKPNQQFNFKNVRSQGVNNDRT